jgi:hypothetical protein
MKMRIRDLVNKAFEVSAEVRPTEVKRVVYSLISAENKEVKKSQTILLEVNPVDVPPYGLIIVGGYARHPLGNVITVLEDKPRLIEQPRKITKAAFHAWEDGKVEKGEVVGVVDMMLTKVVR